MNKLKILFIAIFCMVSTLWSEAKCMEVHKKADIFYNTLKIQTDIGSGSGFIIDLSVDESNPCLITNKHVVYKEPIKDQQDGKIISKGYQAKIGILKFHCTDGKSRDLELSIKNTGKHFYQLFSQHQQGLDLCYIQLSPYINMFNDSISSITYEVEFDQFQTTNINPLLLQKRTARAFYTYLNKTHLLLDFNFLEPIQDILMFGYPNGLYDEVNNLPIIRKGITASNILENYQGKSEILIDAACFPGSSGSPVFIFNGITPKILGVLYAGPMFTAEGLLAYEGENIAITPIPIKSTKTNIPMNLGVIIKSSNLLNFHTRQS